MAKLLRIGFDGDELSVGLEKVDRSRLYGYVDVEVLDPDGRPCALVTLDGDGRTLLPRGGATPALLSPDGDWLDRRQLTPIAADGRPATPIPSSFQEIPRLDQPASIDEYLSHDIRLVYRLECGPEAAALLGNLRRGALYAFPFSHRGGLVADRAFLLADAEGVPFLAVGRPARLRFIGIDEAPGDENTAPEEPDDEEDEELDFTMW